MANKEGKMKKIMALVLVALFATSTIPAFASAEPEKERNLFVIIKDSFKPWKPQPKNEIRNPMPTVSIFQGAANGIKEGSAKAKNESLRTGAAR